MRFARGHFTADLELDPKPADAHEVTRVDRLWGLRREERDCALAIDDPTKARPVRAALVDDDLFRSTLADREVPVADARVGQPHFATLASAEQDSRRIEGDRGHDGVTRGASRHRSRDTVNTHSEGHERRFSERSTLGANILGQTFAILGDPSIVTGAFPG